MVLAALQARASQLLRGLKAAHADPFGLPTHLPLLAFGGGEAALRRWVLASDQVHGGLSESTLATASANSAVWSGHTALELAHKPKAGIGAQKKAARTGWCAIRTDVGDEGWELDDFHGLALRFRPDHRRYVLNLRCDSVLGDARIDDLYQAWLPEISRAGHTASGGGGGGEDGLAEVRIPWGAFQLTWHGYVQDHQPAMNLARVTHVGLLVADRSGGAFEAELGSLAAYRYADDELNEPAVRGALELNEMQGYNDIRS